MAAGHVLRTQCCRLLFRINTNVNKNFIKIVRCQTTNQEGSQRPPIDRERYFFEKSKKYQKEAAKYAQKKETNARYWGIGLMGFVIAVYLFTISRIKQEKFLDESFDTNELAQELEAKAEK